MPPQLVDPNKSYLDQAAGQGLEFLFRLFGDPRKQQINNPFTDFGKGRGPMPPWQNNPVEEQPVGGAQIAADKFRDAISLGMMGMMGAPGGGRPPATGFKTLGDVVTRQLAAQAQGAGPELGPAANQVARNTLMEAKAPVVERAMQRYRPAERTGQRTASQVSSQDLAQDFQANELDKVIQRYDPAGPGSLDSMIRSSARRGMNTARELEATVPKPGEGDIYRMSGKIAKIEEDFAKQFDGRKPSEFWIARKLGITPAAARDAMAAKEQNQLYGSVRFDELSRGPGSRPFSELIPAPESGKAAEAVESGTSSGANRANYTLFLDQLNATDKAILQKMSESKPVRQIADELKAEGLATSPAMISRRQTSLIKAVQDLREGRGFLGKLSPGGAEQLPSEPLKIANPKQGGHEVVVELYTGGTQTHTFGSEAKARKFAQEYLGGDARSVKINGKEIKALSGGSGPAKADYFGYQEGYGQVPGFHMYNLTEPFTDPQGITHPKGTTKSENFLIEHGIPYDKAAKPIGGGVGSEFGDRLQRLSDRMSQSGGYNPAYRYRRMHRREPYEMSDAHALDYTLGDTNMPGEPGPDVRTSGPAQREYFEQLRPYLAPSKHIRPQN